MLPADGQPARVPQRGRRHRAGHLRDRARATRRERRGRRRRRGDQARRRARRHAATAGSLAALRRPTEPARGAARRARRRARDGRRAARGRPGAAGRHRGLRARRPARPRPQRRDDRLAADRPARRVRRGASPTSARRPPPRPASARAAADFLYVSVGSGISHCLVADGVPRAGVHGSAICTGAPLVEQWSSGLALARRSGHATARGRRSPTRPPRRWWPRARSGSAPSSPCS